MKKKPRGLDTKALRTVLQSTASTLAIYTVQKEPVPYDVALKLYTTIQGVLQGGGTNLSVAFNEMASTLEAVVEDHRKRKALSNP